MRSQIDAAQSYIDLCVRNHNAGNLSPEESAAAKLLASELFDDIADEGLQLHGGWGYMWEYPICRLYANARVHRIFAGTSEIMKEIIGRKLVAN